MMPKANLVWMFASRSLFLSRSFPQQACSARFLSSQNIDKKEPGEDHSSNEKTNAEAKQSPTHHEFYDIVICGGGMVGTAMAAALGEFMKLTNQMKFVLNLGKASLI